MPRTVMKRLFNSRCNVEKNFCATQCCHQTRNLVGVVWTGRFGDREMLLAITFHGRSILQRTIKQFGPAASNEYERKSRQKDICQCVSLRRQLYTLRCFDTVFRKPHQGFFNPLKSFLSLSDRCEIFTSDWLSIKVCQNAVFSYIDITTTTIAKNFEIWKASTGNLKCGINQITSVRSKKNSVCLNSNNT